VEKQEKELQQLKEKMAALSQQLVQYKLEQVNTEGSVCLVETALDPVAARNLVNGLAAKVSGHGAVLLPKVEGEYQYIIGSTEVDVRPLAKELASKFGGRGGGSAQMVQGTVMGDAEEIIAFLSQREVC
jgi:alanyl-tRNA synthetase